MSRRSSALRSYDAFLKPIEGVRTQSTAGGVVTLLASTTAALLFLSQLYLYARGDVRHAFHLAKSSSSPVLLPRHRSAKREDLGFHDLMLEHSMSIPLKVHVTFPHVHCRDLDYSHDSASRSNGDFGRIYGLNAFETRAPTQTEFEEALGGKLPRTARRTDGCTVKGTISVPKVGGTLNLHVSRKAWREATAYLAFGIRDLRSAGGAPQMHNVSHYMHDMAFGNQFPLAHNPLRSASHMVTNDAGGVFLNNIVVKLVPTVYKRPFRYAKDMYQQSVTQHIVQPQTLAAQQSQMLPGLALTYDFTPLAVHHVESRENLAVFVSSLVSIVGGVFVCVSLVTGCLVNSAAAVAKKKD